ncbi:MAG: YoaK family protein [Thalassobaculales bacterium]
MSADAPAPPAPPLLALMLVLSATTGLVDAVSVLGLGEVFTANMTGNVVFLGFAIAGAPGFTPLPYIVALSAFMAGALMAGRIGVVWSAKSLRRWLLGAAAVEAALFWIAALLAARMDVAAQAPEPARFGVIALTALAMGFRNATVRQLKVPDLTTTVLTLTITGIAADSRLAGGDRPNLARRVGAVAAIFAGAMVGGALVLRFSLAPPLFLAGALVLLGTFLFAPKDPP